MEICFVFRFYMRIIDKQLQNIQDYFNLLIFFIIILFFKFCLYLLPLDFHFG